MDVGGGAAVEEVEISKDEEEEDERQAGVEAEQEADEENEDTEEDEEEEAEGVGEGSINRIGSRCEYEDCPGKFGELEHEQELDTVTCVNCQDKAKWIHKVKINDMQNEMHEIACPLSPTRPHSHSNSHPHHPSAT